MEIERILVIEPDTHWHGLYGDHFKRAFPGVQVVGVTDTPSAIARIREQRFDLYTTNYPRGDARNMWAADLFGELLRARVSAIRDVHPDAQIALLSARPRSGTPNISVLAQELNLAYFAKQEQGFLDRVVAHYARVHAP